MKDIFLTFFLLAGIQGILLSIILFSKKENHIANGVLAAAVFALSLDLFSANYYVRELYYRFPHLMGITYPFPFLYGPLFYLYTRLISKHEQKLRLIHLAHFLPFIIIYIISLPVYFAGVPEKIEFLKSMMNDHRPFVYSVINWIVPLQGIIYTVFIIKEVINYNKKIKNTFSDIEKINLNWLKYLAIGSAVIWSIAVLSYFFDIFVGQNQDFEFLLQFTICILIYTMGYMGLNQPEIFLQPEEITTDEIKDEKYKKSGLDETTAEEIKDKLLLLMEKEKPFLDSDLTLAKLSGMLCVSGHYLSEVINTKLNQNYYDFINKYRVEEFKARIINPEFSNYNLLSIAFDSGFKSKTSFNTIFKKVTGKTPSEYKSSVI
jgi:AraC-like DNA-binding protein